MTHYCNRYLRGLDAWIEREDDDRYDPQHCDRLVEEDDGMYCDVCGNAEDPELARACEECEAELCTLHAVADPRDDSCALCPACAKDMAALANAAEEC